MFVKKTCTNSLLVLFSLTVFSCGKKFEEPIVAKVGNQMITVSEFKNRYALTPYLGQFPNDPQVKVLALAALIGEKLLAQEARNLDINRQDKFKVIAGQMEKEAVIEKTLQNLFENISVSPAELQEGFEKAQRLIEVQEWVFTNKEEADSAKIKIGADETQHSQDSYENTTYKLKWGDSDYAVENVLWNLKPGQLSEPLNYQNHYYIFRLVGELRNPYISNYIQALPQIRKTIEKQKKDLVYKSFFKKLMAGKKTKVPADILTYISEQMELAFEIPPSASTDTSAFKPTLMSDAELIRAQNNLRDRLDEKFITFDSGAIWTVGDFLRNLRYGPYPLNYSNIAAFRASLRNMAVMMMEQEYVAQEGYRRGLDKSAYVQQEVGIWLDSFLADQMRLQIVKPTTIDSLKNNPTADLKTNNIGKQIENLDNFLVKALETRKVQLYKQVLDSLQVQNLKLVVFKRHFPGRQAAPDIMPLDQLQKYFSEFYKLLN